MKKWEKAWLACAIDGEGCIIQTGNDFSLCVVNTNRPYAEKASLLMDGKVYEDSKPRENRKICYRALISQRKKVMKVLKAIVPFLIIKKDKALEAIKYLETLPMSAEESYSRIRAKCSVDPEYAQKLAAPLIVYIKNLSAEQLSEKAKKNFAARDPEEVKRTQKMLALRAVEKYPTKARRKKMLSWWSQFTPEERSEMVKNRRWGSNVPVK